MRPEYEKRKKERKKERYMNRGKGEEGVKKPHLVQ
jgi:hypothetical protein